MTARTCVLQEDAQVDAEDGAEEVEPEGGKSLRGVRAHRGAESAGDAG